MERTKRECSSRLHLLDALGLLCYKKEFFAGLQLHLFNALGLLCYKKEFFAGSQLHLFNALGLLCYKTRASIQ
jgi:hypothetical protein